MHGETVKYHTGISILKRKSEFCTLLIITGYYGLSSKDS